MRISIDKTDRGYSPYAMWSQVTFNGMAAPFVQIADEEEGKIWFHSHEGELTPAWSGKLICDDDDKPVLKEASGVVVIVLCKAALIKLCLAGASYGENEKCLKCGATEDMECLNRAVQNAHLKLLKAEL